MTLADGIIYAAPVHGFGTASVLQTFIERAGVGYLRFDRPLTNKVAGIVVTGRRYNLGSVHDQIVNNVLLNRMILIGSGFPVLIEALNGHDDNGDIESLRALSGMLERMLDLSTLLSAAAAAGIRLRVPSETERV